MQRTLIAVFDNRGDAQSAIEELVSAGFSRQQIRLSEGDPTGAPGTVAGHDTAGTSAGTGLVDSIRNFLGTMFGTDNSEHVQKYSDAVTRGHHVLTLSAADEPEVERAADIVERFGPVDIDEKATQWSAGPLASEAMRMGAGTQQQSAAMSQQSVQGAPSMMQGGQGAGSQQLASDTAPGGAGAPPAQRSGVKVFEHPAGATLNETEAAIDADEAYYRGHYTSNHAGAGDEFDEFDKYVPAYKYGADRASDEQYRGRAWKDVEPALRSDWEGRHPGSAWDKFKAAVRHGWEKITS
jgi:hypothetical protein